MNLSLSFTKNPNLVPILLTGGVIAAVLLMRNKSAVSPQPQPQPQPQPIPQGDLLAQFNAVIAQVQANPQSVDPAQVEALAAQLQAAGLTNEAQTLRVIAGTLRAQRGLPTGGGVPRRDPILAEFDTTLEMTRRGPFLLDLAKADQLVERLRVAGYTTESAQLKDAVQTVRLMRINERGTAPPQNIQRAFRRF